MAAAPPALPPIPRVDIRAGGPPAHARQSAARLRRLRDDCLAFLPRPLRSALPLLDRAARGWLQRSRAPYCAEIALIAAGVDFPGVWFLNGSYQWGCTTLAFEAQARPWLARTLDWPFPGLGRGAELAHMRGAAGEFVSVTWPGYVGVLTAMAPGRFAAAINQAPMWRRTRRPWLRLYDFAANAARTWSIRHAPPDQLLRQVFETCPTFAAARERLERTPVARPVIFALAGCRPGETCIIERTEESFATRWEDTSTANDWGTSRPGWEGRIAGNLLLSCSFEAAAENSRLRRMALAGRGAALAADESFAWVAPPVLNPYTRLAIVICPADGLLRAAGYEAVPGERLPRLATQAADLRLAAAPQNSS